MNNISLIEWRRAAFKECLLQGKGWVCLRINLVGCLERGWPSRNHSEGLTSHRSYGRTGQRRNGPAASIEWKVSRQTSAKDHEGCISHHMLTSQVWQKIDRIPFLQEKTEKAQCWVLGPLARLRTSAWVPPSPLRPTRTPTCSTRASTNSTLDSCWPMEGDRRHLLIPCCFR